MQADLGQADLDPAGFKGTITKTLDLKTLTVTHNGFAHPQFTRCVCGDRHTVSLTPP